MATKLYTEDIDKTVDWGKAGPEGLPVSGEKVQKFIKETLDSKFGYLYYDKEKNKYYIFSDEDDYNIWKEKPDNNQILVKATFDAPAPASVTITADGTDNTSSKINTVLLEEIDNVVLSFKYSVKDSTGTPLDENGVIIAISVTNGTVVNNLPIKTIGSKIAEGGDIRFTTQDIKNYLFEGTNSVRVTVTSTSTNVSSTAVFQWQVINLIISSDFSTKAVNLDSSTFFSFNITARGTGHKYLRIFIGNGDNSVLTNISSSIIGTPTDDNDANIYIGSDNPQNREINIQCIDGETQKRFKWAQPGKHSLQMYFFVENGEETITSQTLYYEFILTDSNMEHRSYILCNRTLEKGALVNNKTPLQININQYDTLDFNYYVYDTRGSGNVDGGTHIGIELELSKIDNGLSTSIYSTTSSIGSGELGNFNYQVNTYSYDNAPSNNSYLNLSIKNTMTNAANQEVGETVNVIVNSKKAEVQIGDRYGENLVLELSAKNRSNNEPINTRNKWEYKYVIPGTTQVYKYDATFNDKFLWTDTQNGWIDNCLVLNGGATVTINYNIFNAWTNDAGLTFEIDFETADVQNDDAYIMKYGQTDSEGKFNGSFISIQSNKATLSSTNGAKLETNYKDGSRQKIQFIFNPNVRTTTHESPLLMYLVVNGILDRASSFGTSDRVDKEAGLASFTIGNTDGEVTTKIHSIRVYNKALTLDQCVDNYIADSSDMINVYKKNNVFGENSNTIDINSVKNLLPTMIIYGNIMDSIVKVFDKKANVPVDILYHDPENTDFDFFATDVWMSNQGTSSMNYPRRNLRPYFNKAADEKTLRGYAPKSCYDYETRIWNGLISDENITSITNRQNNDIFDKNKDIFKDIFNTDIEDNEAIGDIIPACNKKTLKKKFKPISYDTARNLWHGNFKVFVKASDVEDLDNAAKEKISANKLLKDEKNGYREIKKDLNTIINYNLNLYSNAGYARFKSKDLYTDRWTLKCDYAESSMSHNAGIGRLWNDVMRNVDLGTSVGYVYETTYDTDGNETEQRIPVGNACSTKAQRLVSEYENTKRQSSPNYVYGDIRTSCDGKPIVIFNYQKTLQDVKDENGNITKQWKVDQTPIFLGLYNIMTDKGSTPIFGFENLKKDEVDDNGSDLLFDASRVECWECLQNGSQIAQMSDIVTDSKDLDGATVDWTSVYKDEEWVSGGSDNKNRIIFGTYEARWPDNDDLNETFTNNLETVIRFVNFCIPSVTVDVDGKNGYELIDFTQITDEDASTLSTYINKRRRELNADDIIALNDILGLGVETEDDINNLLNSSAYKDNNTYVVPNNTLYIKVAGKSYKNRSDKFYFRYDSKDESKTYNPDGDMIKYDPITDRVVYICCGDEISNEEQAQLNKLIKDKKGNYIIYFYQTYKTQDVARQSFDPLYNISDGEDAIKSAIIAQLKSDSASIYTEEEDDSTHDYIEQAYIENSGYDWHRFDISYSRDKVTKQINNTTIGPNGVLTARVATFDAKRWRKNALTGERIDAIDRTERKDLLTTVYCTKENNVYYYDDEFGDHVRVPAEFEIVEEGYAGKKLYDYFKDKKHEHFDIWKLAAYYIYLIRFAAVDQVVKNTMMTTEDGRHYYFINYDNDTINGVRNDGYLVYNWDITRETYDPSVGSYAYAGFGSGIWNLLEQDDEFMSKVKTLANAMAANSILTYDIAINMFNVLQSGTWGQRLYNKSEQFKYIDTYKENNEFTNIKYLPFLHGSRASHREWWLRHRFDLYDSTWKAGEYSQNRLEFYMGLDASANNVKPFMKIKAGSKFNFCVEANNEQLDNNFVELTANQEHEFVTSKTLIIGNPLVFLGISKVKVLDMTKYREHLGRLIFKFDEEKDTSLMTELLIGGENGYYSNQNHCSMNQIVGLNKLKALEVLDIRTCSDLEDQPDISELTKLRKFLASESNIATFIPYKGLVFDEVSLPTTLMRFIVEKCTFKPIDNADDNAEFNTALKYHPNKNLTTISIDDCEGIDLVKFLKEWYLSIVGFENIENPATTSLYTCTLRFNEIEIPKEITFVNPNNSSETKTISGLEWINNLRNMFSINTEGKHRFDITKGIITVYGSGANDALTKDEYLTLKETWGDNFFDSTQPAHFNGNSATFITITSADETAWKQTLMEDNRIEGTLRAGQHVDISVTMFPINDERQIIFTPYRNTTDGARRWTSINTEKDYNYYYAYDNTTNSFINTVAGNGKMTIDVAHYTNINTSSNQIIIQITSNLASESDASNIIITLENITEPGNIELSENDSQIYLGNTIDITNTEPRRYDINYSNKNCNIPIDKNNIIASWEDSNYAEFGELLIEYNYDKKCNQLIYNPIISKDGTVTANIKVPFIKGTNKILTRDNILEKSFTLKFKVDQIGIKKLNIYYGDEINPLTYDKKTLFGDQNEVDVYEFNKIINDRQLIRQDNTFTIKLIADNDQENGYNVNIDNMSIILDTNTAHINGEKITYNNNDVIDNVIKTFKFTITSASSTSQIYDGYIEININDESNESLYHAYIHYKIECYLPDKLEVKLYENGVDNDDLTSDFFKASTSKQYNIYIYSTINTIDYLWSDENNEENNSISENKLYAGHQIPTLTELDDNSITVLLTRIGGNDSEFIDNNISSITYNKTNYNKLSFTISLNEEDALKTVDETIEFICKFIYGSKTVEFNENINISYSNAVAIKWNYSDITIQNDVTKNLYYIDKNGRFFEILENLKNISPTLYGIRNNDTFKENIDKYILFIGYLYKNDNGNNEIIAFDPWLLSPDDNGDYKKYKWFNNGSRFIVNVTNDSETVYGNRFSYPTYVTNPPSGIKILAKKKYGENWENNLTNNQIFNLLYDYYRIIDSPNKWRLILDDTEYAIGTNNETYTTFFNKLSNANELIISPMKNSIFTDDELFFIHDYYSAKCNQFGRILSSNELHMLINLDYENDQKVTEIIVNLYNIKHGNSDSNNYNDILFDKTKWQATGDSQPTTQNIGTNIDNNKFYWVLDNLSSEYDNRYEKQNTWIVRFSQDSGKLYDWYYYYRIGSTNNLYCLSGTTQLFTIFGPQI